MTIQEYEMSRVWKWSLAQQPQQACAYVPDNGGGLTGYSPVVTAGDGPGPTRTSYVASGLRHEPAVDPDDHTLVNEVDDNHDPRANDTYLDDQWHGRPRRR
jgi:hypothetical protein